MKDEIIHFLEKNLIGKILFTDKVTYTLGNGKLEGIYNCLLYTSPSPRDTR